MAIIKADIGRTPCELTLLDHWNDIASVLIEGGIALRCEKAYQAICIIVETAKILNKHPDYDAKPEAEKLAKLAMEHAQRIAQERQRTNAEMEMSMMATGDIKLDKLKIN